MFVRKFAIAVAAAAVMISAPAPAQQPATPIPAPTTASAAVPDGGMPIFVRPETAAQRLERIGTAEDPGMDPDLNKHFWRFGHSFHIARFERRLAAYDAPDANFVRPLAMVNFSYEIYQQNDKYVWCWMPDVEPATMAEEATAKLAQTSRFNDMEIAYFARIRPDGPEPGRRLGYR